jgi:hypothetical protein
MIQKHYEAQSIDMSDGHAGPSDLLSVSILLTMT